DEIDSKENEPTIQINSIPEEINKGPINTNDILEQLKKLRTEVIGQDSEQTEKELNNNIEEKSTDIENSIQPEERNEKEEKTALDKLIEQKDVPNVLKEEKKENVNFDEMYQKLFGK